MLQKGQEVIIKGYRAPFNKGTVVRVAKDGTWIEVRGPFGCGGFSRVRRFSAEKIINLNLLKDERGGAVLWFTVLFLPLMLIAFAITADFYRARLHRAELQQAADAAAVSAHPGAWITERVDARGRTWNKTVTLDPVQARAAALDAFWRNAGVSRAAKLLDQIQADAFVPAGAADEVVVTAQGRGTMPFAQFGGRKTQDYVVVARAKAILR